MGHSLSLLTAALLVGQTPLPQPHGKNCNCNKATQGYIAAQPEYIYETQPVSWLSLRGSSTMTTSEWRGSTSETSWIDNRPVLSRVKNWFGRGDNGPQRMETAPMTGPTVIMQPSATGQEYYRRLPTTNEPPLGAVPAQPAVRPERVAPSSLRPAPLAPQSEKPLTIEVEPIDFRPAGQAKGTAPVIVTPAPVSSMAQVAPSTRPNPISPRLVNKVGQPGDYSWITGQLEIRNGTAMVHYATPETVDRYDGTLVLATDANLSNFRSGDLVSVRGSVQQHGRGAIYRVQTIDLIER